MEGVFTPHSMRFAEHDSGAIDGYVANFAADHITRGDMQKLEIAEEIPLDGHAVSEAPLDS